MKRRKTSKKARIPQSQSNLKKSEIPSGATVAQIPVKNEVEGPNPSGGAAEEDLLQALYWVWDAFDRSSIGMFLVYNTALQAMGNEHLSGDKITVGTRKNEWISGSQPILLAFTGEPMESNDSFVIFKNPFNSVPVKVFIFPEDPCVTETAQVLYANEYFKIPNPYGRFEKVFGNHE